MRLQERRSWRPELGLPEAGCLDPHALTVSLLESSPGAESWAKYFPHFISFCASNSGKEEL